MAQSIWRRFFRLGLIHISIKLFVDEKPDAFALERHDRRDTKSLKWERAGRQARALIEARNLESGRTALPASDPAKVIDLSAARERLAARSARRPAAGRSRRASGFPQKLPGQGDP